MPTLPPPSESPAAASGPLRVLVVDDDAAIRMGLLRILQRAGFQVSTAEDGSAGLDALTAGDFDAALVDVSMPKLAGSELLT